MSDAEDATPEVNSDVEREANTKRYTRKRSNTKLTTARKQRQAMRDELKQAGEKRCNAPPAGLTLEHVCGYRGYDCHNNLCVTVSGLLVYHVAAVGIVQEKPNEHQKFYIGHTDDILCLGVHPTEDLVATGQIGKSPSIHIWNASDCKTVKVLDGGHTVGVCATDFSQDGNQLVTLGLDNYHSIVIWDWRKSEKLVDTRGHQDRVFDCIFNPFNQTQLVSVGVKHIKFWEFNGSALTGKRGVFGKVAPIESMFCAQYSKDGKTCYTGSSSGNIYVWVDRELVRVVEGHKGPVFALCALNEGFMSGGKDGTVRLWDDTMEKCLKKYPINAKHGDKHVALALGDSHPTIRAVCLIDGRIVMGTKEAHVLDVDRGGDVSLLNQGHREGEVWGLDVHPTALECATVSDDGFIRTWSYGTSTEMRGIGLLAHGAARCVAYSANASLVAVGYKNGKVQILSADSFAVVHEFEHREEEISDVKFSPAKDDAATGQYLAVASHDNFVDIYDVASGKRVGVCKGASSYITHCDWNKDGDIIVLNTGDKEQLYFEAPSGKHRNDLNPISAEKEIEWQTRTCVLGPSLRGIWPACSDVTDVNAADVHTNGEMVVTGDDLGFVKLFSYPSQAKYAKSKSYNAHSAHVTNVRFSYDGNWLLSVGGADTALAIWSVDGTRADVGGESDSPDDDDE